MRNGLPTTLPLAAAALLALPHLAHGEPARCAPHAIVVSRLAEVYGESRQSIGLGANNTLVEVFASQTGTWTITVTTPGGPTCLVAAGHAFEAVMDALPGTDAPA